MGFLWASKGILGSFCFVCSGLDNYLFLISKAVVLWDAGWNEQSFKLVYDADLIIKVHNVALRSFYFSL